MTGPDAEILADLMKAMNLACSKCWGAEHAPPPASALYQMDDYKWDLGLVIRRELDIVELAVECGHDGTRDELRYAAHREAYARSGEDADLAKMLRHVTSEAPLPPTAPARQPAPVPRKVPWATTAGFLAWGLMSGLEISGTANTSPNRPGVVGSLVLCGLLAFAVAVVVKVVIALAADAGALPDHGRPREALPRPPAHRTQVGSAGPLAAHRHHARPLPPRRRPGIVRAAPQARPLPQAQHVAAA